MPHTNLQALGSFAYPTHQWNRDFSSLVRSKHPRNILLIFSPKFSNTRVTINILPPHVLIQYTTHNEYNHYTFYINNQNHGIFRAWGILRTLSNIYYGTFCKKSYLAFFFMFQEMELSSLSDLKKYKEPTFKKFLIFQEVGLSSSKLKKRLIFQEITCNTWKIKNLLHFFPKISAKEKSFSYLSL